MHDEPPPKGLPERTGKHYCVKCLAQVSADEYSRNDHICDACAQSDEYPLASTPEPRKNDER